jgi:deazaflavin-dependent oxidoreductase (nitroreductase family)
MALTTRQRIVNFVQRHIANPVMRSVPIQTLLETTGRKSGQPRCTPIGGLLDGNEFWLVSEFGDRSQYVRNIAANPRVRVRVRGRWHSGTATLLPDDDARARLAQLPRMNSAAVRAMGDNLLTIRVDLDG